MDRIHWAVFRSGPSISDWIPPDEINEHDLGRKCPCLPEKVPVRSGIHIVEVHFRHRDHAEASDRKESM